MDGARLQTKVTYGFRQAATRVGRPFQVYRPSTAFDPLVLANLVGTIPAAFSVHGARNFEFGQPSDYQKPMFHALLDRDAVEVGDYLVDAEPPFGPFFVASKDPIVPVLAVQCNRIVSVFSPGPGALSAGLQPYGGSTAATDVPILTEWPVSILLASRAVRDKLLPGDAGYGSWRILMPAWSTVYIRPGSIVVDDLSNRFVVQSAERQDLGWRIDVQQAVT